MAITALSITICRANFPKSAESKFSENCWSNTYFSVRVPGLGFTRFLYVGVAGCIGAIAREGDVAEDHPEEDVPLAVGEFEVIETFELGSKIGDEGIFVHD